ncbi:MAG: hypothetical protein Q7T20_09505 [Saprospiraceae bacterium]|nr:hypothetical protein [Saprospiraceae bacterium]
MKNNLPVTPSGDSQVAWRHFIIYKMVHTMLLAAFYLAVFLFKKFRQMPQVRWHFNNSGKELRQRFSDAEIEHLLELRWWNWPIEKITENVHLQTGNAVPERSFKSST